MQGEETQGERLFRSSSTLAACGCADAWCRRRRWVFDLRLTSRADLVPPPPSLSAALMDDVGLSCLLFQELGGSAEGWTDDLASLFQLRDSLEGVVSPDDITVLRERLGLLQCQWKEVCHQVPSPHLGGVSLWF